jgi:hypothetical protein
MNTLESLEKEVADAASQMTVEVVLLLIDKWEKRIIQDFESGKITAEHLLNEYVRMKIVLHHMRRKYDRDWYYGCDMDKQHAVELHISNLDSKVKDARRKYYVAKHRIEPDQHGNGCSCRGCNCISGRSR